MPRTTSLAKYIFTRLGQQGVKTVFGVPGDFTLKALDHLDASGLKWVGNCNELNAGYAADGYARLRGLGAVFTTYGVGELSAINAIAGSYAEQVSVVHIVGSPQQHLIRSGAKVHHTLGDGRSRVFAEIHEKVTVAQAALIDVDAGKAAEMVDDAIEQCLVHSKPAYIELPCDMVPQEVPMERLEQPLSSAPKTVNEVQENREADKLLKQLHSSKQPLLLVDRGDGIPTFQQELNTFVETSGIPTLAMPSGNSIIDHSIPNFFGVHSGPVGQIDTMPYVESSDLVIAFGPMFSDTQTLGWKVVPDPNKTITIGKNYISFATSSDHRTPINAKRFLRTVLSRLDQSALPRPDTFSLGNFREIAAHGASPETQIDQTSMYLRLNLYLRPNDTIILGNATPILGGRDFHLPSPSILIASGMWFSIGQMLPAALGAALAQRDNNNGSARTVLFDGDGSFQVTAQELSTIIREKLNVTIFIVNNAGYAYERQIHGMDASYNSVADWRYLDLARAFGAGGEDYPVYTFRVETWRDLDRFLGDVKMNDGKGLKMVELVVGKYDVPEKFMQVFKAAGEKL